MSEGATEKRRKLFLLFKEAIEDERRAQRTYQDAMRLCEDAELLEILKEFYRQEVVHEETLIQHYNRLREKGGGSAKWG